MSNGLDQDQAQQVQTACNGYQQTIKDTNTKERVEDFLSRGMYFQQCGILTSVDSDKPVQLPLSLETPNAVQSVA